MLSAILVAPVTRRVRELTTEIPLGTSDGLREPSAASFDNLQRVLRGALTERVGVVAHSRRKICRALSALADC